MDYTDIYIKYKGHPKYNSKAVVESDLMRVIIQKLEMILYTNKGEVLGDLKMGCNIEYYLWKTKVPADIIKKNIITQINKYVPELNQLGYDITVELYEGTVQDIMIINIFVDEYKIIFDFS